MNLESKTTSYERNTKQQESVYVDGYEFSSDGQRGDCGFNGQNCFSCVNKSVQEQIAIMLNINASPYNLEKILPFDALARKIKVCDEKIHTLKK